MDKLRLLTPGPTPLPEDVRLALARDMIHHRKANFKEIMDRVQQGLKYLFGTKEPVLILTSSGTGAMNAAVTNLFIPGEKVLVVEAGKFGQRWSEIAQAHGLEVVALPIKWGQAVKPRDVENALSRYPDIKGLLVQASETSTGVLHPVKDLAGLCRSSDRLLVVDGISAVGISPCPMDEWGIDCLVTGSQKGIMLPPGLAFISLSQKAWEKAQAAGPGNFYFNLLKEREKCLAGQTLFTPAINLIVALEECLKYFQKHGLDNIFKRQQAMTSLVRTGADSLGLELLAQENYTWGLTSIKLPPGVDGVKLLTRAASDYNVIMAGGQDHLKGRIVRMGHMGYVDWSDLLAGLYALRSCLIRCGGYSGADDYLERAMAAYEEVLGG
ncbi:pyridoxal-phosphate-dependent aminotransferase family protein [Desulfonatronovibrio hydrogenovorans]|uniref:pyridoxal-phosphate-dependent aminotransferase family protein n=1 Tax=Desulfonatronovibrio hydrogenovorans TaxID=53245 RepID=UPI00054EF14B|nr:alanine--glyoxylate aminotransferase family protein [Desulfonatronovibrio hydrogenovorans]